MLLVLVTAVVSLIIIAVVSLVISTSNSSRGLSSSSRGLSRRDPEVEEVPDEDEHGFDAIHDLIMDVDGMKDLLGMYREGLYHIHRAWQPPFFTINVKLLLGTASDNDEEVIMNTLAFFIIAGLIQQLTRNRSPGMRPVDVLREAANSDSTARTILITAMNIRRGASGPVHVGPSSKAVKLLIATGETMGRRGRLSAVSRIARQLEKALDANEQQHGGRQLRGPYFDRSRCTCNEITSEAP